MFLRSWESGHCYTYNPRGKQEPIFSNRIGLFLGHTALFNSQNNFKNFIIYIHEKGQFWPRGKFYPISILPNEYKVLRFQKKKQISKKENNNCNGNKKFSFTSCVNDYIKNEVGCSLKLFDEKDSFQKCFKKSQLLKMKVKTASPLGFIVLEFNWISIYLIARNYLFGPKTLQWKILAHYPAVISSAIVSRWEDSYLKKL